MTAYVRGLTADQPADQPPDRCVGESPLRRFSAPGLGPGQAQDSRPRDRDSRRVRIFRPPIHEEPSMSRTTYANVVATLALLMAASAGGAYAASQLPKDSVRSKQVKDHSLTVQDFKAGQLAAGPQGVPGPRGPSGPPGPDLLGIGRQDFDRQRLANTCDGVRLTSSVITVPARSVVWLSGSGIWSYTGEDTSAHELPTLDAVVQGGGQDRGSAGTAWMYGFNAQLRSEGVVMDGNHPLVLEPGTSYRFAADF